MLSISLLLLSGCDQKNSTVVANSSATPANAATSLSADQLYQLVAPMALFPDNLVAQVLSAAKVPVDVESAQLWLVQHPSLKGKDRQAAVDAQSWDDSVKGLLLFPSVLSQMALNISWTQELGEAYQHSPEDVMNAIQVMRQRASASGTLKNTQQQQVVATPRTASLSTSERKSVVTAPAQTIVIKPANPSVVYVPSYNPVAVYGAPMPVYPGYTPPTSKANSSDMLATGLLSFGIGVAVGAMTSRPDYGWQSWGMHWGGGPQPPRVYHAGPTINHPTVIINSHDHPPSSWGSSPHFAPHPAAGGPTNFTPHPTAGERPNFTAHPVNPAAMRSHPTEGRPAAGVQQPHSGPAQRPDQVAQMENHRRDPNMQRHASSSFGQRADPLSQHLNGGGRREDNSLGQRHFSTALHHHRIVP
nr:DUF3300 domain-containing protein [Serratia quinivorans]